MTGALLGPAELPPPPSQSSPGEGIPVSDPEAANLLGAARRLPHADWTAGDAIDSSVARER